MTIWTTLQMWLGRFRREDKGVTAIEYGLLAALIAVVIIIAVAAIGTGLNTTFNTVARHLNGNGS